MVKTRCSNCGSIHYINDNDTFPSCPSCNTPFSESDKKKSEKIRDISEDDNPTISFILFVCAVSTGIFGTIFSFVIGNNTGYYDNFNFMTFFIGIAITAQSTIILLVLKTVIDSLYCTKKESKRIREFMEYEISKQLEERK